jgi:hypothetical protein
MHKKLEAELVSIAHSILQMKNREDAIALHEKAQQVYEKLSVLTFIDRYMATTPNISETKEELAEKFKITPSEAFEEIEEEFSEIVEKVTDDVKKLINEVEVKEVISEKIEKTNKITLEEEFKNTVSVEVTQDLFKKVAVKDPNVKTSLNDKLLQENIQVGLNDRIAFVKHLFNHSQEDFNRVLSQLNTMKTGKEAKNFINKMVKPDYDWSGKEDFEERLIGLVERRFL